MTLFLSIIGFSLNVFMFYLLYDSFNHSSREAGIKYYYLSTFSSGLIISGIFFAYLIFHNLSFISITWILHHWSFSNGSWNAKNILLHIMIYFLTFGFLFKLSRFSLSFMSTLKFMMEVLIQLQPFLFYPSKLQLWSFFTTFKLYFCGFIFYLKLYYLNVSFFFNDLRLFGALGEQFIKRFIAYSSINQMGFLFMGLACGTFEGVRAALLYLLLYILMNLGFFILFLIHAKRFEN